MKKILTVEEIKRRLRVCNLSKVAAETGLHENTVYNFMRTDNPHYKTAEALSKYLEGEG